MSAADFKWLTDILQSPNNFQALVNLAIVILPLILTWLGRRYVSATGSPRKLEALGSAAAMAVDMVEDLDQKGHFKKYDPDAKGEAKRREAYRVVRESLKRSGWTLKEGSRWPFGAQDAAKDEADAATVIESAIQAELQRRYGVVLPVKMYTDTAREALKTTLGLQRGGRLTAPEGVDPRVYLLQVTAGRLIALLAKESIAITPEHATAWVQDALISYEAGMVFPTEIAASSAAQLKLLIGEAAEYLSYLKAAGDPSIQLAEGEPAQELDRYIVTAWLLTEAARRRLNVTTTDIGDAASQALTAFQTGSGGE